MPLLRKAPFVRAPPPSNLKPTDEVFFCEATKEAFIDYEEFFQRTILCNSLVWSCAVTGKSNLTFEEALESEEKAKKRYFIIYITFGLRLISSEGSVVKEMRKVYLRKYTRRFCKEIREIGVMSKSAKLKRVSLPSVALGENS